MSFGIYHDLKINSPVNKVFEGISQPSHLENWWPLKCSGLPRLDEEYNFFFGAEYDWYGKVVNLIPNQQFIIRMTKSDTDWDKTEFGFDLSEKDGGTYMSFSHQHWKERNSHFKFSSFCWALLLNRLKNYLEKGVIVPFENRN